MSNPKVAIVMGSDSDYPIIEKGINILKEFDVEYDVMVMSAHRTPHRVVEFAESVEKNGFDLIIGAAGKAAHLPGVLAALTILPVIGIPIKSSTMDGMDSLLSIVQMPTGIPVATVAINGSENAALLAVQIMSLKYSHLKEMMKEYRLRMAKQVEKQNEKVKKEAGLL